MNEVYLVVGIWDYEGEQNLNIFDNLKSAEKFKKVIEESKMDNFSEVKIEKHEVLK